MNKYDLLNRCQKVYDSCETWDQQWVAIDYIELAKATVENSFKWYFDLIIIPNPKNFSKRKNKVA